MTHAKRARHPRSTTGRKSPAQVAPAWLRAKVAHVCPPRWGGGGRTARRWRRTVRLPTRMPRLRSSPRSRAAPHRRCPAARRRIAATVSADTGGRRDAAADLARQTRRNPCRCQRSSVSGRTLSSAARHPRARRARRMRRSRSAGVRTGRPTRRRRTTRRWRRRACSATRAAFVLVRSPTALPTRGPVAGLVHARRRRGTARRAARAPRLLAVALVRNTRSSSPPSPVRLRRSPRARRAVRSIAHPEQGANWYG